MTKTRREFTDEFEREAVVLLRDSGRPLTQVAADLGLEPSVLRRWRSLANGTGQGSLRGPAQRCCGSGNGRAA